MIDHQYKTIFIHQRKVAGMSISRAWGFRLRDVEDLGSDFHAYNDGVLSWDWNTRPPHVRSYFVFSAVRNPFDRLISGWKHLESLRHWSLREVLENLPWESPGYEHLTRPQVAILREPSSGELVTDDLIRFESLQSDFDRICERVGRPRIALPAINESERERGYRQYFDTRTRRMAEDLFAEDLEEFGYEF